jgi:GDP-L-fucose synthase
MIYDNMLIELNLYKAVQLSCPKAKIINPVSNCTYPGDADIHSEPDWQRGAVHDSVLPYASSRRMIYALAESYWKQYNIKSVNWLIANAYGPGDYSDPNKVHALNGIIIRLLKSKKEGDKTFEIWGSGTPTREWVYIEDVAKILCYSIDNIEEQVYPLNLAQNKAYSISEIAGIAAKALDYDVELVFNTKFADGAPTKILDNKLFRQKYPSFSFTPLNEGIKNTIEHYKKVFI